MKLNKLRVRGFQSFGDSGELKFLDGINLIIGQNNAGKSALLRAMLPGLPDDRHRTQARWESHLLPQPTAEFTFEVSGAEICDWILLFGTQQIIPSQARNPEEAQAFMAAFFQRATFSMSVKQAPGTPFSATYPSHELYRLDFGLRVMSAVATPSAGEITIGHTVGSGDTLPTLLWNAWQRCMFYFAAERMTIGEAPSGYGARLQPNAGNLPNVLSTLNGERGDVFRRLVGHLREIFPSVGNLSVRTKPDSNNLEIRVWPTELMERVELGFPLNSSGTGVAQVIALLTAIMTADNAIFIIDEINSFLHPAAIKSLLRILQTQYTKHQYIISTYSPEVIGFSNPRTIYLVKREGYELSVKRLDLSDVGNFREVAEHLGVSMADVFAADRVVWVEGPTEELCFRYLHEQLIGPLPRGIAITSVAATGDFNTNKRDPAIVYEVYSRLSTAAATLVVAVVFSFDTEKLTVEEKAEMRRRSGGLLHFLPRRHFECYLIDPHAIAAFIIHKDPASAETVTPAAVDRELKTAAAGHPLLIPEWNGEISDTAWLARVDAAKLILSVCGTLSNARAPFAKKEDSLFLLRHILEHGPEKLAPLKEYIASLVAAVAPA